MNIKITYTHKLHYDGKRNKERLVKLPALPSKEEARALVSSWWNCDQSMIGIVSIEGMEPHRITHEELLEHHGMKE
ncbi:MAG: hypothetical protein KGJ13_04405 [Patescibacteria group bacterium]|nr:hypothetical protein [Patescibacteria group bacterium]